MAYVETEPTTGYPDWAMAKEVHYYLDDHLGTSQMELSSGGWPLWQGQFTPFGQELDTQATAMHYKFTGKERDSESGLDYFGARYYGSSMGRFMSPDWAAKAEPVPYSRLDDPQSLNLYSYVGNNPLSKNDPDGHCGQQASGGQDCSKVTVQAQVSQKPTVVQNQSVTLPNGQTVKATSIEGKIVFTVKQNGQPVADAKVTETNQNADTRNGEPVRSTLVQGQATTNADGQIQDKISIGKITDGTKDGNNAIKSEFSNNTWTSTDKQTLTITTPGGCTCTATSTRTLSNAGADGPSSKYTLTTTQPEVKPQP